jgi:hypothetical protein
MSSNRSARNSLHYCKALLAAAALAFALAVLLCLLQLSGRMQMESFRLSPVAFFEFMGYNGIC